LVFVLNNFTHLEGACGQVRGRASAVLAVEHHEIFFVFVKDEDVPPSHKCVATCQWRIAAFAATNSKYMQEHESW
jgi:hypothetical protein